MERLPVIVLTMGDPAGVGPEICVKALQDRSIHDVCTPCIIGSEALLYHYADLLGVPRPVRVDAPRLARERRYEACFVEPYSPLQGTTNRRLTLEDVPVGQVCAACGAAAECYIMASIEHCLSGDAAAVATAPLNKESLVLAGSKYIDHTEMYAGITGSSAVTMFEVDRLRVFFLTRHVSLQRSIEMLSIGLVRDGILSCHKHMRRLGFSEPRIAVAAMNPHAGEGGMFGTEEGDILSPAVQSQRQLGIDVTGPVPADAVFSQALKGRYDAVLSLYHDQGHIATKTYDFERTVSVTLGLPFIRTSVDHGTAFDIAGKGIAGATSMVEAVKSAARYAIPWRTGA